MMGNQHSHQLNLKQLKKIKQKSRINLSLPNSNKNKIKERGSAFLCHSNGSLIANIHFKCNFCSTVKRTSLAIKQHYAKRHYFTESLEQLNELEKANYFASRIEQTQHDKSKTICTLFIQDNDLIIRCSSLNYGILKLDDENEDLESQGVDQIESDLRIKRINELDKLRQELTKLNTFSRFVESAEKEKVDSVRQHSIRLQKFDDDTNLNANSTILNETEDQMNNNHYYTIKSKDDKFMKNEHKIPNSASDGSNSSSSSLCQSDTEQTQDLFDDLTKNARQHFSETSSVDTTFGLDAKCSVCNAKNYVVCIQSRLGKQICAVCFRYFKHFLSEPVVYACQQLGKCELNMNKSIKSMNSHINHSEQKKSTANRATSNKHIVKQQQLGIFKSKSNTLQSTPKVKRPLQQKELSFYSITSYSNNNSLNDQSKSMTLNLPSKNNSFKDRISPTNRSNWTTPSPTQSNVSFAKYSNLAYNESDVNFNSNLNMNNTKTKPTRCQACWIKKCMDIYYEVQFDEKIIKILNDFHPIQLTTNTDNLSKNHSKLGQQSITHLNNQFNQQCTTLSKKKRYYTNNKLKSKSISRLYYPNISDKAYNKVDQPTSPIHRDKVTNTASQISISQINSLSNNISANESKFSNSIKDLNDSLDKQNIKIESNDKNVSSSPNYGKNTKEMIDTEIKFLNITSPSKSKSDRSNSTSSNDASFSNKKNTSTNTITLNNSTVKSSAINSLNIPISSKHSSILPNENYSFNVLSISTENNENNMKSDEKSFENIAETNIQINSAAENVQCSNRLYIKNDMLNLVNENFNIDQNNTVRLILENEPINGDKENTNTIEVFDSNDNSKLNLFLSTNIHNVLERV